MSNIDGLKLPRDKSLRPRRPIEGLEGYQVTPTGQIWLDEYDYLETESREEFFHGELGDSDIKIHCREAASKAWLTPEQRKEIRELLREGTDDDATKTALITSLIDQFQVSKSVIWHIGKTSEDQIPTWSEIDTAQGEGQTHSIRNMVVQDYKVRLIEAYRPPSKGGNTSALHLHSFSIGKERFYFTGRGAKKWIFKDDRASFQYVIGPEGGRKVQRTSLRTIDSKGNIVRRGDRSFKKTLRTAKSRPPGGRREMRD